MPPSYMVFFDTGQAVISPQGEQTIGWAAAVVKIKASAHYTVIAHTDEAEVDVMTLSMRRANAVKDALIGEGVLATSIKVIAKGSSQPLVLNPNGAPEQQNRFAEIVIQ